MRNEVDPWRENVNWATDTPGGGYPRRHLLTHAVGVERDGIVYELFGSHASLSTFVLIQVVNAPKCWMLPTLGA